MKRVMGLLVVLLGHTAMAAGAVIDDAMLAPPVRSTLSEQIASARKANPGPFSAVAAVRARMADMDANKRGRIAPVTLALKPLGAAAFFALLDEAAFSGHRGDLKDSAWLAWQVGVIESLGTIRDDRALPVLEAALRSHQKAELVRAAATAIGRVGTDDAARLLIAQSSDPVRGEDVRAGMGNCRRLVVAQALAAHAQAVSDERSAVVLAKALSDVGNAWAWDTATVRNGAPAEEGAVREVAAAALVDLFTRFDGPARQAASNALLVVDASTTHEVIDAASREAPEATKSALAELSARLHRNPAR